jgi:hypothetical protein
MPIVIIVVTLKAGKIKHLTQSNFKSFLPVLTCLFFTGLYLLFPNENPGIDAWGYASEIKYSIKHTYIHHLLFIPFIASLRGLLFNSIETIWLTSAINSLGGGICLYLFYRLLKALGHDFNTSLAGILLAGFSFGFWRYCIEGETYILPLLFAIPALHIALKHQEKILFVSTLCALAALFHQLYLVWWVCIGLWLILKSNGNVVKKAVLFFVPLLGYCFIYWLFYLKSESNTGFLLFLTGEYATGGATASLNSTSFLLAFINLFRTFIQINGNIPNIFRNDFVLGIMGIIGLCFLIYGIVLGRKLLKKKNIAGIIYILFIAQFLFALISNGNAEFMTMLVFLTVIILVSVVQAKPLLIAATGLCLWNLASGVLPLYMNHGEPEKSVCTFIQNHSTDLFISENQVLYENILTYRTGKSTGNLRKGPYTLLDKGINPKSLLITLDSAFEAGVRVYTDHNPEAEFTNRATLLRNSRTDFWDNYVLIPVYSGKTRDKTILISQVTWKSNPPDSIPQVDH